MLAIADKPASRDEQLFTMVGMLGQWDTRDVHELMSGAYGYAWGWLEGQGLPSCEQSWDFHNAYGLHVAEFKLGYVGMRWSINDAWQAYQSGRAIGEWN